MFVPLIALALAPAGPPEAERLPPPRLVRLDADSRRLPDGALTRLGTTARRHVNCAGVRWAADGKSFVTVGAGSVKAWDAKTGAIRMVIAIPDVAPDSRPAYSADGTRYAVAAGGRDGSFEVRAAAGGEVVYRSGRFAWLSGGSLALSADASFVAAAVSDARKDVGIVVRVLLVRVADGREIRLDDNGWAETMTEIAFAPEGRRLYAAADGETRAYDAATGKKLWSVPEDAPVAAASADGTRLVTRQYVGNGWKAVLRDAATGAKLDAPEPEADPFRAALSVDGTLVALHEKGDVVVRGVKTGKAVAALPGCAGAPVAFSPDGKTLVTTGDTVRLWDVTTGKPKWPDAAAGGHSRDVERIAWSADGRTVATAGADGRIFCWDADAGKPRWHFAGVANGVPEAVAVVGGEVRAVFRHFDDDGRPTEFELRAWDAAVGKPLRAVELDSAPSDSACQVTIRAGEVVVVEISDDATVVLGYDAATGKRRGRAAEPALPNGGSAVVSDDGRYLLTARPGVLRLADRKPTPPFEKVEAMCLQCGAWNADGTLAAGIFHPDDEDGRDRATLRVYERATGRLVRSFGLKEAKSFQVVWSPDGRSLVSSQWRGKIERFDLANGAVAEVPLPGWARSWDDGAWSSARQALARLAEDGTVLIWDGRAKPKPVADAAGAWADLGSDDAAEAWAAVWALADAGTVGALAKAKRVEPPAADAVAASLVKFDDKEFRVREAASKRLAAFGEGATGLLRAALGRTPSAEAAGRIEALLAPFAADKPPAGEALRTVRAIAALERIGTAEAQAVLKDLAAGVAGARVTEEARDALDRLGVRP